jgi:hypothetical protein
VRWRGMSKGARTNGVLTLSHSRWDPLSLCDVTIVLCCSHREASGPAVKNILQMHRIRLISSPATS